MDEPQNVVVALARVQAEIGGIGKMTAEQRRARGMGGGDERGISYAYRGIDQIAAAAQPLFGKYGVVIVPSAASFETKDITVNGKPWTDGTIVVEWSIYGPGGAEDVVHARTVGLGRDNSDKSANKAITQAFKNLLLRLLCIGDPDDDVDGHTHERDSAPEPIDPELAAKSLGWASRQDQENVFRVLVEATKTLNLDEVKAWVKANGITMNALSSAQADEWNSKLPAEEPPEPTPLDGAA